MNSSDPPDETVQFGRNARKGVAECPARRDCFLGPVESRLMKAYIIDPFMRQIVEVEHNGDYHQIYQLIGNECQTFAAVYLKHFGDAIYVDDEGLFKQGLMSFAANDYPQPLFGRGVVLGSNSSGESTSPKISIDELRQQVRWLDCVTTGDLR